MDADAFEYAVFLVPFSNQEEEFTLRISAAYPKLTRNDLDYCCLYLLGLTDADIAALMQRAYNTVNERNSKLRKIFHSKNALPITLKAIANESV